MNISSRKLLELKSIIQEFDKIFLKIRLTFEENIDIYVEIDEFTRDNISNIIRSNENHKFRLSLSSYFDSTNQQYLSKLTRTHLDRSEKVLFQSSKNISMF